MKEMLLGMFLALEKTEGNLDLLKLLLTAVLSIIGAWIGGAFGAKRGFEQFRDQQAFGKRLAWYEEMISALLQGATNLAVAATLKEYAQNEHDHEEALRSWRDMQPKHLLINQITAKGILYAQQETYNKLWKATGFLQELADQSNAFNFLNREHLDSMDHTKVQLRRAADALAEDMRAQLGIDPLGTHPRDLEKQPLPAPPAGL
ncbi:hypothetical protein [Hymenobacter sp. CRA2]|uniref:hypothetical protein n=1 Tax=Hymenobacter sp. CRA2 TaxID=1955620 RepID=UPI00098F0CD8|nr:hypothetical protein [Hymenobacter sp. CRA2]OON71125.1 hypothetical protein B0919_03805 [Hymenobacter sp. CRA2]